MRLSRYCSLGLRALSLLGVLGLLMWAPAAARAQKKVARPTVAILYFDYDGSSEEMGFLRKGLTQMLVSDLSDVSEIDIVERVRLQDAIEELELNRTNKIDQSSANRIGKLLGARYLVMGGYFDIAGTLRMDARVVEVETGKIVTSIGKHSKAADFMDLEQYLAAELARTFRQPAVTGPGGKSGSGGKSGGKAGGQNNGKSGGQNGGKSGGKPIVAANDKNGGKAGGIGSGKRPQPPKALDAKQAAAYGKALDAIDRGDARAAEAMLTDLVTKKPDFEMASLDLASLRR
jgi:TolB-like protein